jgi:GT2 family glycosyltransferase
MENSYEYDVTIILVNFNTSKLAHAVVDSIISQSKGFLFEIIIIDNSCNSNEFNRLSDLSKKCTIINSKSNLGFGNANNLGATMARGKYLFFLNTDTCLVGNAIFELKKYLDKYLNVGIVGSNLITRSKSPNFSYCEFEKNLSNEKKENSLFRQLNCRIFHKSTSFNFTSMPKEIFGFVSGASLMIRKECFDYLNGFSSKIFMYGEDALLCFRLRHELHKKIINVPSSIIIHFDGGSNNENLDSASIKRHFLMAADGNYLYYKYAFNDKVALKYLKYYSFYYQRLSFVFALLFNFKKVKKYLMAKKIFKDKYSRQKMKTKTNYR